MIELRTLGTIDLRDTDSGRALDSLLAQEKRSALLFYLALASPQGPRRRDEYRLMRDEGPAGSLLDKKFLGAFLL